MKKILSTQRKVTSNLKLHSFDLGDQDREALVYIREHLGLTSHALAVRVAIRELASQLKAQEIEEQKQ